MKDKIPIVMTNMDLWAGTFGFMDLVDMPMHLLFV
jgi:hypothetical protein